jgi:nucleoside-diphosphate-sugar epimerase
MRIFVTGATGFIGSNVVSELIGAGHQVLGLARSDAAANVLAAAGAEAYRGDIENFDSLRSGADLCEGVIHTAFDHDFSKFVENCEKDRRAIEALGSGFVGTTKPLVITSSTAMGSTAPGARASEDVFNATSPNPRVASELAGQGLLERGVHVITIRNSQIHDTWKQGLVSDVIALAQRKGISAYIEEGDNACRPRISPTPQGSIAWRSKKMRQAPAITALRRARSASAISLKRSARDMMSRYDPSA